jgi:hypothetical protein
MSRWDRPPSRARTSRGLSQSPIRSRSRSRCRSHRRRSPSPIRSSSRRRGRYSPSPVRSRSRSRRRSRGRSPSVPPLVPTPPTRDRVGGYGGSSFEERYPEFRDRYSREGSPSFRDLGSRDRRARSPSLDSLRYGLDPMRTASRTSLGGGSLGGGRNTRGSYDAFDDDLYAHSPERRPSPVRGYSPRPPRMRRRNRRRERVQSDSE